MKILVGIDDDGHLYAYNLSTPEQEAKILRGICKDAQKQLKNDQKLLDKSFEIDDFDTIYQILEQQDILCINQRGGPSIIKVENTWDNVGGILNI